MITQYLNNNDMFNQIEHMPNPITHGGTDRGYKACKCSRCGKVDICTPTRNFYTTDSETGPLVCEPCLLWKRYLK